MFKMLRDLGATLGRGRSASPEISTFVRTNCFKCAEMMGFEGPLPRRPPEPGAASTAPRYDPGRASRPTPIGSTPATPVAIRAAVERSLPLLQDAGVAFVKQTGCASCHHNSVVSMAVATARTNGFAVNETTAKMQSSLIGSYSSRGEIARFKTSRCRRRRR
jgi:cytochrome c553